MATQSVHERKMYRHIWNIFGRKFHKIQDDLKCTCVPERQSDTSTHVASAELLNTQACRVSLVLEGAVPPNPLGVSEYLIV